MVTTGGNGQLTVTTTSDNSGTPVTVSFTSSSAAVATIDATGLITDVAAGVVTITATAYTSTSTLSGMFVVTIAGTPTSIANFTTNDVSKYPLPTTDQVTISSASLIELKIYNAIVVPITGTFIVSGNSTLDVNGYQKGLYFAKLEKGNTIVIKKLVIQ